MPLQQILEMLHRRPFVPFRLHLSDGRSFTIQHPELVMTGRMFLYVGVPAEGELTIVEHMEFIALMHIVSAEEIAPTEMAG